ncbi:futalosine hydrolase [Salisediminibacterium halotolerans]|uniref:futalosine hydrolase n=1 Tax=Salisediminibacterium halotolerans TaxID=517425 RepID=UPI000F17FA00|nr:futalosine hydrolase [Salisediminibacterium halotolerans]RLJ73236.1 futalosine hydrolase [Actinophytocola xinjiangensis]RPE86658.1 futalosine hydrolase [Salisediminibacterium halotolerans]TWG34033.1 futalosine hydrolase [Salisediminibacterium halotolerans]GEL08310.1 Futalosine hydrolase [Salisediminibacterium halotolerans]
MTENIKGNILIVTSVEAEKKAIEAGIGSNERVDVIAAGVGPVIAAVNTVKQLHKASYGAVINMGIAGGMPDQTAIGDAVIGTASCAADLGFESPDGFKPIDELGFATANVYPDHPLFNRLSSRLGLAGDMTVHEGVILTLSTVTGTEETRTELQHRIPEGSAEAMEGFGIMTAAQEMRIPAVEVRAVSNYIGLRNKDEWRLQEAFDVLTKAAAHILKELSV